MRQKYIFLLIALCVLSMNGATQSKPGTDRRQLVDYLKQTAATLERETQSLSAAQWSFKPAHDRWSVAECVEHLALAEFAIRRSIEQALTAPPAAADSSASARKSEMIRRLATDRAQKFEAPEVIRPTGRTPEQSLKMFRELRKATIEFAANGGDDLHLRSAEHPLLKMLTIEEWLLLAASHTERHARQLQEVKVSAGYPKK